MLWKPVAEMARWEREIERMLGNFLTGREILGSMRDPGPAVTLAWPSRVSTSTKKTRDRRQGGTSRADQGRY